MRRSLVGGLLVALCAVILGQSPVSADPSIVRIAPPADDFMGNGLTVPWVGGGMRIERDGTVRDFPGDWPTVPFGSLRLWDSRTAWLDLEPAAGIWAFQHLDEIVERAEDHGMNDIVLVLWGTPRWAASQVLSTDAAWMGPGSAAAPRDVDDWRKYIAAVATRYAGRIGTYEIGNEPNLRAYWNGTPDQWRLLVTAAVEEIRRADPAARILVSVGVVQEAGDELELGTWLRPIAPLAADHAVDGVALHVYPTVGGLGDAGRRLDAAVVQLSAAGWGSVPRWVTEMNVRQGSSMDAQHQVAALTMLSDRSARAGFRRIYWYGWTDLGPADLVQLYPGTAAESFLAAVGPGRVRAAGRARSMP